MSEKPNDKYRTITTNYGNIKASFWTVMES